MNTRVKLTLSALAACVSVGAGSTARAGLTIQSVNGGAPSGVSYVNFDNQTAVVLNGTPNGSSFSANVANQSGTTTSTVGVSFTSDAGAVLGSSSTVYAAPFLSGGNGLHFGSGGATQADGQDATTFLTTGTGTVTLSLGHAEMYIGLLWGSVDSYNSMSFYRNGVLIGTGDGNGFITGSDVTAQANGNQGAAGTYYVNINSTVAFDTVVMTSTSNAFEFDNVSFNATPISTSEPSTILSASIAGLMALGYSHNQRRRRAKVVA
jgi:hypothetical protein